VTCRASGAFDSDSRHSRPPLVLPVAVEWQPWQRATKSGRMRLSKSSSSAAGDGVVAPATIDRPTTREKGASHHVPRDPRLAKVDSAHGGWHLFRCMAKGDGKRIEVNPPTNSQGYPGEGPETASIGPGGGGRLSRAPASRRIFSLAWSMRESSLSSRESLHGSSTPRLPARAR
jgi:hypothetical protein